MAKVNGVAQTQKAIKAYAVKVKAETRKAIARVATKALQAAKAALPPDRTGMLRRSMGKKVGTDRKGNPYGLVGPRRGFKVTISTTEGKTQASFVSKSKTVKLRNFKTKRPRVVNPLKYAPFVAKGTKRSRKKDFLAPAIAVVRSTLLGEIAASLRSIKGA